jgi:predicted RNA-binding protein YlxR (DUF448 family)
VGCGRRAGKDELVRLAAAAVHDHDSTGGAAGVDDPRGDAAAAGTRLAVIDHDGRLGGRGAYLCREADGEQPNAGCLARAIRRGSVGRTLRASVTLDPKLVESVGR